MLEAINNRNIKYLIHFTSEENIDSIIQNGLIPRGLIDLNKCIVNDEIRLDGYLNYSSFSIGFPNFKMLWKYRNEKNTKYCIIGFNVNLLLDKECLFCFTNAASSHILKLSINELKGKEAFNKMYEDNVLGYDREELNLPDAWPTDPQAEVLIKGIIEPTYILGINFNDDELTKKYKDKYSHINIKTNGFFFNNRMFAIGLMKK